MSHFLSPNPVTTVCWENMWRVTAYCVMMRGPSEGGWETDSAQWAVKKRNWGERKEKRWGEEKGRACSHCSTRAWNRALCSASPIIHSLDKELCLSQGTRGWEMTKLKNKLRDRSNQCKERFCEMPFAATPPRCPFKRYLVSAIHTENMTPFRPTKNHNFVLSILLWPQSWNVHHKAVFLWPFYPAASDLRGGQSHLQSPKGTVESLEVIDRAVNINTRCYRLRRVRKIYQIYLSKQTWLSLHRVTNRVDTSRTSSAAFWPTKHVEYASGSRWDRSLWLAV